jgi:hypothetical protein
MSRKPKKNDAKKLIQGEILRSKIEPEPATADKKEKNLKKDTKNKKNKKQSKKQETSKKLTEQEKALKNIFEISFSTGNKYFVETKIFNRKCRLLVDSGSQINVLPSNLLPKHILRNLEETDVSVKSYSGDSISVLGTFKTNIRIGKLNLENIIFYVVNSSLKPILGTPALASNNITLSFTDNLIIQNGLESARLLLNTEENVTADNFNLQIAEKPATKSIYLQSTEETKIDANSEKIILCKSRFEISQNGAFATEPNSANYDLEILIAKSVSNFSPEIQTCLVRVCNPSKNAVVIPKNRRVCNASRVQVLETNSVTTQKSNSRITQIIQEIEIGTQSPQLRKRAEELIIEFQDVFATDNDELGQTPSAIYDINTGNAPPQAQQRYKTPYYLRSEMERILKNNVKSGLMKPTSSPWAAPVLLVKKANGSWRLVCDYRKLNQVTVSDSYPLPEITDLVNQLSESRVFSVSDLFTGFHQIPCTDSAKEKLAITTEFGQYTWNRMPMGAKNCPAVFQRLMDNAFRTIPRSRLVIYLDDILAHSATEEENIQNFKEICQILRDNNLKLTKRNC